jgi:CHAT domain-containing protein
MIMKLIHRRFGWSVLSADSACPGYPRTFVLSAFKGRQLPRLELRRQACMLLKALAAVVVASGVLPVASIKAAQLSGAAPVAGAKSAPAPKQTPAANDFNPALYTAAILRLSFTSRAKGGDGPKDDNSFVDLILVPPEGEPIGRRSSVTTTEFASLLRELYSQLSRQASLDVENPRSPARQLYRILFEPLAADIQRLGITTLLISAEQGLQAVPFAALHDGRTYLGERLAFSLTPSLALTPLTLPSQQTLRRVAVGASQFDGLAALPLVPQEVKRVEGNQGESYLNRAFTPDLLLAKAGDPSVDRLHVATHAEFLPGGPAQARLFTGTEPLSLARFASLRQRRSGVPLDLIVLSACRTALGDRDSELGFAGLALQAGARSAIGTLWYVDDVVTSAFFVQFYRYLDAGLPKAEALEATRKDMAEGRIRLSGDHIIAADDSILLDNLTTAQQRRVGNGMQHPFFWAGITLLGTPW